jgi:tetratricopeptide (TPR) repeat protein
LNGSTTDPSYDENVPLEKNVDPVIYCPPRHAHQRGDPRYSSRKASSHQVLAQVLYLARHNDDAIAVNDDALALGPDDAFTHANRGLAFYALGNFETARSSCEIKAAHMRTQLCLSITYDRLGRHSDAEAQVAKIRASASDAGAYQYAEIYAQWGKPDQALEWLDTAVRLRSPWLVWVKKDPLLDPLRNQPRYQAIVRALKFPV